jgi:hypothetical protein
MLVAQERVLSRASSMTRGLQNESDGDLSMKAKATLLLASVAGLATFASAQAADLPVKAKPVEYVKICTLYGPAFYYIPGTDTCIRIGGHIRAEVSILGRGNGSSSFLVNGDGLATQTRDRDIFFVRNRVYVNVDTRTQTSFGTLRSFSVVRFETITGTGLASGAGLTNIDTGIIQWGGFSIGQITNSNFDNPWIYAFKWGENGSYGWPDSSSGRFVASYTHAFGNGITGTLALEDPKLRKRGNFNGANALSIIGIAPTIDTRGGNTWPEVVGQLRIEQAWGGFHLAGHVVNNHVAYNCGAASGATTVLAGGCSELAGHPSDKVGGGVTAALKFNVPTGVNDAFYVGGSWSKGSTMDVLRNNGLGSGQGIYGGTSLANAYGSFVGSYIWDSVYTSTAGVTAGGGLVIVGPVSQQLTTAYGGTVAFEHGWNAEWRTSIFGGAEFVDYNATANAILCSKFGFGSPSGTLTAGVGGANIAATNACNFDYRIVGAGSRTYWSPVRDFTLGVEFQWSNHHVSHADGVVYNQPVISGFKPNAAYEVRDQNVFSGLFSVRRFF